jgi:uncharacterized protein
MSDAPAENSADAAPVSSADRISSLDFIRGLAVMGILAANIVAFGQPFEAYMYPAGFMVDPGDPGGWQWITQFIVIDGKMRGLFTLLFGAGLYLFMERTWGRGGTRWRQMWRLFILMLFGMVHFYLIWPGDILFYYAVVGFVVVPCLRWSAKTQMAVGIIGYISGALLYALMMTPLYLAADTALGEEGGALAELSDSLIQGKAEALTAGAVPAALIESGDYAGLVEHRVTEQWYEPIGNVFFFALETFPLMLIGIALYRTGFFSGGFDTGRMKKWGWAGLIGGGLVHLAIALLVRAEGFTYYSTLTGFVGWSPLPRLAMVLGMAALLVAYSPTGAGGWTGWLGSRVSAAGRAAFTNYLGTSIVMLFVFHGWALGLFGDLNRPQLYGVTALTCALMLLWSKPWLERFRYGPLEWLWRCMTYGKIFPLKR